MLNLVCMKTQMPIKYMFEALANGDNWHRFLVNKFSGRESRSCFDFFWQSAGLKV